MDTRLNLIPSRWLDYEPPSSCHDFGIGSLVSLGSSLFGGGGGDIGSGFGGGGLTAGDSSGSFGSGGFSGGDFSSGSSGGFGNFGTSGFGTGGFGTGGFGSGFGFGGFGSDSLGLGNFSGLGGFGSFDSTGNSLASVGNMGLTTGTSPGVATNAVIGGGGGGGGMSSTDPSAPEGYERGDPNGTGDYTIGRGADNGVTGQTPQAQGMQPNKQSGLGGMGGMKSLMGLMPMMMGMMRGNGSLPYSGALNANASTLSGIGQQSLAALEKGQLPPGAHSLLDQQKAALNAKTRNTYANLGLSGSTMEQQAMQQNEQTVDAQKWSIINDLLGKGTSALEGASNIDLSLMKEQIAKDQRLSDALSRYVYSLAGGSSSGGSGGSFF